MLPGTTAVLPALGLSISRVTAAAAITAISLDGQVASSSRRILISHLTEQQNSGTRFSSPRGNRVLSAGSLPHLVHSGSAHIELRLVQASTAEVWALSPGGHRLLRIPSELAGNVLAFTADPGCTINQGTPCLHYEIVIP